MIGHATETAGGRHGRSTSQGGMTLIELMVAMLIGMVLSLAIFAVLSSAEGQKRTMTSVNDVNQAGNTALHYLEKWIRSAGSGFVQSGVPASDASAFDSKVMSFGCTLLAAKSGTQILPRGTSNALPAPFGSVNTGTAGVFPLAPVLIAPDQTTPAASGHTSDVLIVMGGTAGSGETPTPFTASATSSALTLQNSMSFNAGDMVLVVDQPGATSAAAPCAIQQIASGFTGGTATSVTLGGTYAASTINGVDLTSYSDRAMVMNVGNVGGGNPPNFLVVGVGDNNTLFSYDLLRTSGNDPASATLPNPNLQGVADGVFELHALYGVDTDGDGRVDTWISPSDSGSGYALSDLTAGTQAAAQKIARIKAVRVGLILRTALSERASDGTVAPATLTLFSDLGTGLTYTRTLAAAERQFRYRTAEMTIPLRNSLILN